MNRQILNLTATVVSFVCFGMCLALCCTVCLLFQPLDCRSNGLCFIVTLFHFSMYLMCFFKPLWFKSNGCDELFHDWIWTSWFIGWSRFNLPEPNPLTHIFEPVRPTQGPVSEPTRFILLKPNIFYCFIKYTSVFLIITLFYLKNSFSLGFSPKKNILLCVNCFCWFLYLFILFCIIFVHHFIHI